MPDRQDRIIDDLMEHMITHGPGGMATVFTRLFNLAMRFERENFLGARHYERNDERRGYANGVKSRVLPLPAAQRNPESYVMGPPRWRAPGRAFRTISICFITAKWRCRRR